MKFRAFLSIVAILFASAGWAAYRQEPPARPQPNPNWDYTELGKAPEKYRSKANPLENDPEAIAAGGILFEEHCQECHGEKGVGGKKAPSLRAEEVQSATPGTLFWILSNGVVRKGMPVWSKLPEPQRWQIIRYVKSLRKLSAPEANAAKP